MQKSSVYIFLATAAAMFTVVKCASGPAPSQVVAESEATLRYAELKAARQANRLDSAELQDALVRLDALGITDAKLYACVKQAVEYALAHSGSQSLRQVTDLTELDCKGRGVYRLNGLQHFTQLETLDLSGNHIESAEPLGKLYQLKELNLNNNEIQSIWPLLGLDKLIKLSLKNNPVQDLNYLGGFDRLETIEFVLSKKARCDYLVDVRRALSRSKASLSIPSSCLDEFGEPAHISDFE
jgi:DNA-binding HxlR family transcriptional regulator